MNLKASVWVLFIVLTYVPTPVDSACSSDHNVYDASGMNLTSVSVLDFMDCETVSVVNLSYNLLSLLANDTFSLTWNISILDISHNELTELPNELFRGVRKVEHLYLSHNQLGTLPSDFFMNKPLLITVDLSHNRITHIPLPVFRYNMSSIQSIDLQYNRLTAFEPWAYYNQAIKLLDLRHNNISTFTNDYNWTIDHRVALDIALTDMRNNSITRWYDYYLLQYKRGNTDLEVTMAEIMIDIRHNPIICDCNLYNIVFHILDSFFRWSVNPYQDVTCAGPPGLAGQRVFTEISLDMFVCNLTDNCPNGCLCQEQPQFMKLEIDCRNANMTSLPQSIPRSNFSDIAIHLDNNSITTLNNVSYLDRVLKFTMANNMVTDLPAYFMQMIASDDRAEVDFSNNKIKVIPENTRNIKYKNTDFTGNRLECSCSMVWMKEWINLAPSYYDNGVLNCTFEGNVYKIIDLDENILNCKNIGNILLIVLSSVALAIVTAVLIFAKRCPYETKVIIFKIFRIHPADKYKIDKTPDMDYDMYVTFDENDVYVRQWVKQKLFKNLEEKKPFYRLCTQIRDGAMGTEAITRLDLIERSRRCLIILSRNFESKKYPDYDTCQAETLEQNKGRIMFILYDKAAIESSAKEPLASKLKERKVFNIHDKLLLSKLRYELPRTPCSGELKPVREPPKDNGFSRIN